MSSGIRCKCKGSDSPGFRSENWVIRQYKCNHSAFNGWKYTPSDYSALNCLVCDAVWRTKASYIYGLRIETYKETQDKNQQKT